MNHTEDEDQLSHKGKARLWTTQFPQLLRRSGSRGRENQSDHKSCPDKENPKNPAIHKTQKRVITNTRELLTCSWLTLLHPRSMELNPDPRAAPHGGAFFNRVRDGFDSRVAYRGLCLRYVIYLKWESIVGSLPGWQLAPDDRPARWASRIYLIIVNDTF